MIFSSLCMMAEVCFGGSSKSLWACFRKIGVSWLGTEILTMSLLPRLKLMLDTKISLLYPAVPDLIFRSCH